MVLLTENQCVGDGTGWFRMRNLYQSSVPGYKGRVSIGTTGYFREKDVREMSDDEIFNNYKQPNN